MDSLFNARPVGADTVRMAYAVMLLGFPRMSLAEFRKDVAKTRHGILTGIFDRRGYAHALFRSRVVAAEDGRATLMQVQDLILSDAISAYLLDEMVDAVVAHARDKGCDQMTVQMVTGPRETRLALVNTLENHGFSGQTVVLSRRL